MIQYRQIKAAIAVGVKLDLVTLASGAHLGWGGTVIVQVWKAQDEKRAIERGNATVRNEIRGLLKFVSEGPFRAAAVNGAADPPKIKPLVDEMVERLGRHDVFAAFPTLEHSNAINELRYGCHAAMASIVENCRIDAAGEQTDERRLVRARRIQKASASTYGCLLRIRKLFGDDINTKWIARHLGPPVDDVPWDPPETLATAPKDTP